MEAWLSPLLSTESPALPTAMVARAYLVLGWGLVLGALLAWGLPWRAGFAGWRRALPALVVLWCLLPVTWSPAYWLGLAFRAPSLTLTLLCVWSLLARYRPGVPGAPLLAALRHWAPAFIALGWLLLLDTLALLPWPLYAWGFAPWLLAVLALAGQLPWLLQRGAALSAVLVSALLLFVVWRLPSGNVWDVLLDPWLWLWLQADWLRHRFTRG